ncbi:Pyridoxal phosphate-dependent transferase domain 1 [Sesbania bispinosa]|nr:Pyridoxal phosphate-dependent transferase domain 1 [Sesbania bispinosa]
MAAMQLLMKRTIATAKANHSKFQACNAHRFSSLDPPPPPPLTPLLRRRTSTFIGIIYVLNIVEGKMQYLFDENGRRYLDAFAGIVTVSCGHCHPEVLNAIIEQSKLLQHATTIYLHHTIGDFAEALTSKMPGNLKVVYFVNSGSEANELAMLMALYIPGEIHHVMNPDPIAESLAQMLIVMPEMSKTILTMGVGGAVELAPGYLKLVYDIVHKAGGVSALQMKCKLGLAAQEAIIGDLKHRRHS